ncbi:MAG: ABC transporter ATP-binding protein [Mucilaginibacter sp.]|nr:ABC transporter ATP-binding protein [Mucilaginibacter sp.]
MSDITLEAKNINKYFHDPTTVKVLSDINFSVNKGDFVAITGKSGCGKSTLLYILSTMDTDYEGELLIDGESMVNRKEPELAKIRNEKIGFVFQFHYLLDEFTVLQNVMLPGLKLGKYSEAEVESRAIEKLKMLGIEALALKQATQISGGEKQRVAIARALINDPHIIMGDEPTGNLDTKTSIEIMSLVEDIHAKGNTIILVTHEEDIAMHAHRIVRMRDGLIVRDYANTNIQIVDRSGIV